MDEFMIKIVEQYGYIAVIFLMTAESIFPPIPSEIILLLCGFLSSTTKMKIEYALLSATLGSVFGAIFFYYVGTLLSKRRIKESFVEGKMNKLGFRQRDLNRATQLFNKHGTKLVFFGRLLPIVRSLISVPAGIVKMNKTKFFIYTFFGSLIKNFISIYLGYIAGSNWESINKYLDIYKDFIVGIFVIGIFIYIYYLNKRKKNEKIKHN